MSPKDRYDPRYRPYRVAVYVGFLGFMGFVMFSLLFSVIRFVFFR